MNAPPNLQTQRRLAVLFSVPFAFSVLFFALTLLSDHTDLELQRVQNLTACIAGMRSLANDLEIGEHGFLLTGSEQYLIPLEQANANLPARDRECSRLAKLQSTSLQSQVGALASLIGRQGQEASRVLDVFHRQGSAAALDAVKSDGAADLANETRRAVENLDRTLAERHDVVLQTQRRWNAWSYFFFVFGTAAMVLVMVRLYHAAISYLHGRDALQARLHQLNAALESQVEQRTRDLKVANEELQQFAYVASHDLQEPLRTITSFTQLLGARYQGKLDADADEFMGYIVTAAWRMTDLINGLLALARLRKTGQPTAPVSFNEMVAEVAANMGGSIREHAAVLTFDDLPSLVVDRMQISQLLQNLVSNAIKYRRPNVPPQVHISAQRDAGQWVFSVKDNGLGFDPTLAERIFGLFQRIPGQRAVEGTGIGLSIARKIAERHGGRIWAESTEGQGSTFRFSLPVSLEVSREPVATDNDSLETSRPLAQGHSAARG